MTQRRRLFRNYPELRGVLSDDLPDWKMQTQTLDGRTVCVARRYGITVQLIHDEDGWRVTKLMGGKVLAEVNVPRLPQSVTRAVEAAKCERFFKQLPSDARTARR